MFRKPGVVLCHLVDHEGLSVCVLVEFGAMVAISQAILFCLHVWASFATAKGISVNCDCTTDECKQHNKTTCSATLCYVQYFAQTIDDVGKYMIRGCIDHPNSILCDNKRPEHINDPWPVLMCCAEDWCNRDVIPTAPPWLVKASKKEETKDALPETSDTKIIDTTEEYNNYRNNPDDDRNRKYSKMINPIYISVPIAGACVLLAIIIFAIFLLKRKNHDHFYRDYNITNNANGLKHSECCAGNEVKAKPHTYPETERTSATSESKLLMKV
ncbi:uncharacterized protein LOC135500201 [Lineus longissimus]|uniref:uncharacterized protein LOC135500201 n=1 Tax=Lineus longissimus TaxID=88925 RepID=UPI002B4E338A